MRAFSPGIWLLLAACLFGKPPSVPSKRGTEGPPPIPRVLLDDGDGNMLLAITNESLMEPVHSVPKERPLSFWSLDYWFLGDQWDSEKNAALKLDLQTWLGKEIAFSPELGILQPSNPVGMGFPFQTGSLKLPGPEVMEVSDSDIRNALLSTIKSQGEGYDTSTLNVIFLAPRLVCDLGPDRSGRNFVAFLSDAPSERGALPYLVVACSGDRQDIRRAVVRGVLLHEEGPGGSE